MESAVEAVSVQPIGAFRSSFSVRAADCIDVSPLLQVAVVTSHTVSIVNFALKPTNSLSSAPYVSLLKWEETRQHLSNAQKDTAFRTNGFYTAKWSKSAQ